MNDAAHGDGNGQGQRDGPEIEGQVPDTCHGFSHAWQETTDEDGSEEGTEQQGKDLGENQTGIAQKGHLAMGMQPGYDSRYDKGYDKVDEDGVGGQGCLIASELACHDGGCRGRGTYQAKHASLYDDIPVTVRQQSDGKRTQHKETSLEQDAVQVPRLQVKLTGTYFQEGKEQHDKDEQGLYDTDGGRHKRMSPVEKGKGGVEEVGGHPH